MVWSAHSAAALSVLASATKDTTASLYLCAVCLSVCYTLNAVCSVIVHVKVAAFCKCLAVDEK